MEALRRLIRNKGRRVRNLEKRITAEAVYFDVREIKKKKMSF